MPSVRFPAEDGGSSLAEMAQRDLDAALQLLADRAQYITGASGAAIALRRTGMHDMLCRASTGSNAPELGALLSTEFGLSGESVRTRQALRCDDAERDARVNREVCRQLGIASVVVMPVVNDDEVLGVFELFSGKANAFGERDLSAVKRLGEMVETAVRMAQVTEKLPERLQKEESSAIAPAASEASEEILDVEIFSSQAEENATSALLQNQVAAASVVAPQAVNPQVPPPVPQSVAPRQTPPVVTKPAEVVAPPAPAKKLFWSATVNFGSDAVKPAEVDQSNVPPVLRGLKKCEACGFPVSAGRALCVECEEKKWRGQLRRPLPTGSIPAPAAAVPSAPKTQGAELAAALSAPGTASPVGPRTVAIPPPSAGETKVASVPTFEVPRPAGPSPELVLSAGLAPPQSWVSRNRYVVGILVAVAVVVVALVAFR